MHRSRMTIFSFVSPNILQDERYLYIVLSRARHLNGRTNFKLIIILYNSENLFSLVQMVTAITAAGWQPLLLYVYIDIGRKETMIGTVVRIPRTAIYISIPTRDFYLEFASILFRILSIDLQISEVLRQKNYKNRIEFYLNLKRKKRKEKENTIFDESSSETNLARCKLPNRYVSNHKLSKKGLCNYA